MKFTDITLGDASVEAKVETLGVVLDKKLSEISSQVSTVSKLIGPIGPKGDKGDIGLQGIAGINGQNGKDGLPGRDGKDGKDGIDGSHGISVVNASVALDGALVLELSDGTEVDVGEVVGPAGAGGLNGAQGPMGLQGPQGEQGIQGIQGVKGDTGEQGIQGIQGIQGVKGDTGDTGATGPAGATGATGPAGVGVAVGGTTGQVLAKIDNTDYNTQWVTPASGGVSSFNTRTGAVTLTSSDVTTALTYTPYNATNPNGYTSNVGTVTSVGGTGTVSGLTLTGTVTASGNLTLGGTLSATASNISDFSTAVDTRIGAASINALSDVVISSPANTQVLTYNGTNWVNAAAPSGGGGGSITHAEASLSTDVQMPTSGTWYDGPSLSLAAGTWLVNTHTTFARTATTALTYFNRITDGTTHHSSGSQYMASVANHTANISLTAVITLASTTTIKIQSTTNSGATSALMKAALLANGSGNNATQITAIKLA